MSIKIRQNSTKNVIDVVFGTSSSAKKNVNKVVDWNENMIWERVTTKDITGKLSFSTNPSTKDFYSWDYDTASYTYSNKFLTISNVKYTGTSPATAMTAGADYEVTYTGDTSGTITHSGYTTEHNNAVAHIKGIGNYTGQVDVPYTITHENKQRVYTEYYYELSTGTGCKIDSTSARSISGNYYASELNSITVTVSSTDASNPRVKMGGTAYASPHTFTCTHGGAKGEWATFSFSSAPVESITGIVSKLATHTAGQTSTAKEDIKNCAKASSPSAVLAGGVTIITTDRTFDWNGSTVNGVSCVIDDTTPWTAKVTYFDGELIGRQMTCNEFKIVATSDGTVFPSGSWTQQCHNLY